MPGNTLPKPALFLAYWHPGLPFLRAEMDAGGPGITGFWCWGLYFRIIRRAPTFSYVTDCGVGTTVNARGIDVPSRFTPATDRDRSVTPVQYRLDPMQVRDIPAVIEVERSSFSVPWPADAYRRELEDNVLARYLVLRGTPDIDQGSTDAEGANSRPFPFSLFGRPAPVKVEPETVGYAGLWLMIDEAHVTSVAVRPSYRGRGLGRLLMWGMFEIASNLGARWVTLEVRMSNTVARQMYEALGFKDAGVRPRYYTDNNEDALIMWSEDLQTESFQDRMDALKADLDRRFAWQSSG